MYSYFTRVLTEEQVNFILEMMRALGAKIEQSTALVKCFAPDGDELFVAIQLYPETYVCRFHKEVFDAAF